MTTANTGVQDGGNHAPGDRVIAVEEHIATEGFLAAAHTFEVVPGDRDEIDLMRVVETTEPMRSALTDLEARLATMDAIGQDMALLSLNAPGVQPYPARDAVPLARTVNDSLAEIVRRHPTRFGALGTVAPQDPTAAAAEVERIMSQLRLSGLMINSHTAGHYLDEPQFAPLLDAAESAHAPLYLHPRFPSMLRQYERYGLQGPIWGYQAEAGLHAMRLILSGVLDRNPDLTIVLGHLGEGIPYWLKRINNRHAFMARTAGTAGSIRPLELTPSEYFRRNFVITTSGMTDPRVLELAFDAIGEDRIMFAIDAPYEDPEETINFLRDTPLSAAQRSNLSHATAERVFGLRESVRSTA
ncbi:amidohydrolase family protein [Amycolatopsis pithecellobii]|uniref:Amidohydrolase family protein n=1 Tax=Amycolatopsis pithecellobii TaxID=664692 RepID=A0A6N7Z6E0_9PSEU|nr:amidohydrolase family protein [Amycolatopsis pithecellobii]MTD56481.1 amidohydrolase family protein [Amycolatopsis pithecellobii]